MVRSPSDQQRIDAAFEMYEAAMMRLDRYEVAAARIHLIRLLVATGWDAPQEVLEQVARDEKALRRQAEMQADAADGFPRPPTNRQPPVPEAERPPRRKRPRRL